MNFTQNADETVKCQFVCPIINCRKKIPCIHKKYARPTRKNTIKPKEIKNFRQPAWHFANVKTHLLQHFKSQEKDLLDTSIEVDHINQSHIDTSYEILAKHDTENHMNDSADMRSSDEKLLDKNDRIHVDVIQQNTKSHAITAKCNVQPSVQEAAGASVQSLIKKFSNREADSSMDTSLSCSLSN